ncbi:MAG TPA: serine/threonine-protein kinase [Polyangiaceae bacterium]|nr:serine/threonine-protein kinase [Polyangiaceae bacterium]
MNRKQPTVEVRLPAALGRDSLGQSESETLDLSDSSGAAATLPQDLKDLKDLSESIEPTLPSRRDGDDGSPNSGQRMPTEGDLIGDTYRVIGELGRGAMGVVLMAEDQRLERKVAIKLVRPDLLEPGFRTRFLEEARAMARVNHPNVVCVHALGTHHDFPYFVMEFVDGQTLEAWLAEREHPIDLDLALRILNDLCVGVTAIHAAGTVHRDIKPGNILIDADLRVRITDFGVSTLFREDGTIRSEIVGTPAYMAPEVAFATEATGPATLRADVYSLACVAYELITGRPPFELEGELAMMIRHATEQVPLPSMVRPDLPRGFDTVLMQALAKKPEQRTATVESFRRALTEARRDSLEPVRILIAEDDDDFRDLLEYKLRLEFPGAAIEGAADGRAALLALEKGAPSVAILDLQMPYLDGLSLTAALRSREECSAMPIIVLTASGGPKEWQRLSSMGVDRFMVKPVNLDDVVTVIRNAIRERSSAVPPAPASADSRL